MRIYFLPTCLLLAACGTQPPAPASAPETPTTSSRGSSSAWECDPREVGLWNCKPAARPAPAPATAPATVAAPLAVAEKTASLEKTAPLNKPGPAEPEPEPARARAGTAGPAATAAAAEAMSPVAETQSDAASQVPPIAERITASNLDRPWALQVGAFNREDRARAAAGSIGQSGLEIVPIRLDGEDWYVLVLATYPSKAEAKEAEQAYLRSNPRGATWVRSTASLRASMAKP